MLAGTDPPRDPLVPGGVDFVAEPLLTLLTQIATIVLGHLQTMVLFCTDEGNVWDGARCKTAA